METTIPDNTLQKPLKWLTDLFGASVSVATRAVFGGRYQESSSWWEEWQGGYTLFTVDTLSSRNLSSFEKTGAGE